MAGILFEDIFDVKDIDPDGMKFDRGSVYIMFWCCMVLDSQGALETFLLQGLITLLPLFKHTVFLSITNTILILIAVSRLHCESESFKMDLILDVNIQIYPVDLGKTTGDQRS